MPRYLWALAFLIVFSARPQTADAADLPKPDWAYVQKRMKQAGLTADFIRDAKKIYDYDHFIKVLELNVISYLRDVDYHAPQVTTDGVAEVRAFIDKNKNTFRTVEKRYGVPPEVISSLLFIETRHGANQGSFHVVSVFLHLIQADRPSVSRYLKARIPHYTLKNSKKVQAEVGRRTKRKAKWAMDELKALHKIYKQDKKLVRNLRGSFSGAFGMAQFIPTSYVHLAKPFKPGHAPDLRKPADAITSVAHYLDKSGWKKVKKKTHKKALMRYNNSSDYANAILSLSKRAQDASKIAGRDPASKSKFKRRKANKPQAAKTKSTNPKKK